MNIKEIVEAEKKNTCRINLYREGLFFRAYEASAFALCSFVHPFKVIKRQLKVLNGEEVAYVGFPASSEDKYLNGRNIIESDDAHKMKIERLKERGRMTWHSMIICQCLRLSMTYC